jgi:hypothetical protein
MWQIYSRKHLQKISIRSSPKQWVYGNKEVDLRLDLRLCHFFFWARGFPCLSMDGHPQPTVVLFPCSLATQGFQEATMGITVCLLLCLFSCSTERSKRGECCIYGLSPWRMASVVWCIISLRWWSFQTQLEMRDSAGDASWVRMHAYETYKTYSEYRVYMFMNVPIL